MRQTFGSPVAMEVFAKSTRKYYNPNRMHHWKQLISDDSDRVNACCSIYCLKKPDPENKVFPLPALDQWLLHNVKDREWGLNSHTHSLLSQMERVERLTSVWHLLDAQGHKTQVYSTTRCQTASPAGGAVGLDYTLQLERILSLYRHTVVLQSVQLSSECRI